MISSHSRSGLIARLCLWLICSFMEKSPDDGGLIARLELRLHIVNPNTTATMTQGIAAAAKAAAPPGVEIVASEPEFGPASIEGYL